MYISEDMIYWGLSFTEGFKTPQHRKIAVNTCIRNPRVNTLDRLKENVQIINNIPVERIDKITISELKDLGCVF